MEKRLQNKIDSATAKAAALGVTAQFKISDTSTQADLRLRASWVVFLPVDRINPPKDMAATTDSFNLWSQFRSLNAALESSAGLIKGSLQEAKRINGRSKAGQAERVAALSGFEAQSVTAFLADLKHSLGKRALTAARQNIIACQAQQKELLKEMRRSNSVAMSLAKQAKADQRSADTVALASGEFWLASREAIKNHFSPPFDKNYLADVSERWRAALYLECESVSYKTGYGWRHKLAGTGRAYLCGIDDNGDEWGHQIRIELGHDDHYNQRLEATVEEAMAELFGVFVRQLVDCRRQGDLLFRPCSIPTQSKTVCTRCGRTESEHERIVCELGEENGRVVTEARLSCYGDEYQVWSPNTIAPPTLEQEEAWEVRESHRIVSPTLRHNGRYFAADTEIRVEHTSHQPVVLPAGEYCLHPLLIADAD